jgi:ABC-2 type transport system permease protein
VTTAVRNPATAAGVVLGLLYLFPIIGLAATDPDFRRHLEQIGPMAAGSAIQATTNLGELAISPWRGLAGWAAAALISGRLAAADPRRLTGTDGSPGPSEHP